MHTVFTSLGKGCAVIGAQWGDEGKGKVIDLLAEHFAVIARASGGANAGHTIVVKGVKRVFHLLPSGCLHEGKPVVLGAGMVIHLPTLLEEIAALKEAGIEVVSRMTISSSAHILFDYYKEIDAVLEARRSKVKGEGIGTTKRGIGPAYMEKAARSGIRMEHLADDLRAELTTRAESVQELYGVTIDVEGELSHLREAADVLKGCIGDPPTKIRQAASVLIEGAQGTLLDIDHGTYPYVTSSATTAAGALQGLGLPPSILTSCIGVAKAYCTRVGAGAFLTEAEGETAERLRKRGGEYGATTGRPRRCGWLHVPDLQRAALLNGFTHWNITKLDVLDEEKVIHVGVGIDGAGRPIYQQLPGWRTSTQGITVFDKLPKAAQEFIRFIEEKTSIPATFIGTGPGREEMIVRE
ncbi:TPA: adenylosuccinate synthase [Candidatus Peribacteria bacterium]|nr:MAG: adenylosuccinate synthase [Candidatus Peribacteria bacterium RIFOXYC2_FULL_58_10]OGJ83789.1 MAG: adenylosuccinate synthase [Candidatus Peribacteria bacterium RIFOXYD2_FULL_58_15]HAI98511.1 adenylosuccinate synthase [Candidatus Peribacteria bacterium]HAS34223.1 adenylosuccinate synthase [Candidatus Peribacteria bacterium]